MLVCTHLVLHLPNSDFFYGDHSGGATGALIPSIERAFGIGYARIAILFVSTFMDYAAAAAGGGVLSRKIGFGSALLAAVAIELIGVSK